MSLWKIAWRSIQQRAVASGLTALAVGLGVALVVAVLVIHGVVDKSFRRGGEGYDLIVGPKGGKLQLILNSVYYLEQSPGMLPYSYYEENFKERLAPFGPDIETAVPICMGHHFPNTSYQVVGTTSDFFDKLHYRDNREYTFDEGENFKPDGLFDAVIGSEVARRTGMTVGSTFKAAAGQIDRPTIHEDEFTVVGILDPTSTPVDRALYVNLKGFYEIHGISHKELDHLPLSPLPEGPGDEPLVSPAAPDVPADSEATEHAEDESSGNASAEPAVDSPVENEATEMPADTTSESAAGTQSPVAAPPETPLTDDDHAHEEDAHAGHDHEAVDQDPANSDHEEDAHAGHDHEAADQDHAAEEHDPAADSHADHDHDCGAEDHGEPGHVCGEGCSHGLEISAILVCVDQFEPGITREVARQINLSTMAQAVEPAVEIQTFFKGVVGNIQLVLLVLAVITVVVAGMGIMVSIYNSMSDRRHEIAIMRALGASRATVMIVILLESILLSLGGGLIGLLLGHGLIGVLSPTIESSTGVIVSAFNFQLTELILIPGLIALASMVGYLPALVAYRTDVARSLTQHP